METVRLALEAMATRFELVLQGEDAVRLRAAGEEALREIKRLETQLSFYSPTSDISRINDEAASQPVRVEPRLFRLFEKAFELHSISDGAFDIALAPLMQCWGFVNQSGSYPSPRALEEARRISGMNRIQLDVDAQTISFSSPGVMIDLGAIGKGYAIEEAVQILTELGVSRAFLHGGTSTMYALGRPADADTWKVALPYVDPEGQEDILTVIDLVDASLSVSAVSGKFFAHEGEVYGHVLDPRAGKPVKGANLAAVVSSSATETDALSTALLVLGPSGLDRITRHREHMRGLVLYPTDTSGTYEIVHTGIPLYTRSQS